MRKRHTRYRAWREDVIMEKCEVEEMLKHPSTKFYIGCGPNAAKEFNSCITCGDCLYCKKPEKKFFNDYRAAYCTQFDKFVRTTDTVPE